MNTFYKHSLIALLAIALVVPSPILAFAKDNGNNGDNGNGKNKKTEKVEEKKREKEREQDQKVRKDDIHWVGCVTKSFGHLIAPGWIKKNGAIELSDDCSREDMPRGIAWLYGYHSTSTSTTTPDTTAPTIRDLKITNISSTTALIAWETNERADGTVWFSTNSPVHIETATSVAKSAFTKEHRIILTGLSPNTTYYVIVRSKDVSGNTSTSSETSFKTKTGSTVDTSAPVIVLTSATSTSPTTARIAWSTDELADTRIWYSTTSPVTVGSSTLATVSGFDTDHVIALSGLNASTTYYALIVSKDITGNTSTSSQITFTTPTAPVVVVNPIISNIIATVGTSTVKIAWDTDKAADSTLFFGTTTPLDIAAHTTASTTNSSLVTDHEITVSGLATSTTYYFIVQSVSSDTGIKRSNQFSLTTSN